MATAKTARKADDKKEPKAKAAPAAAPTASPPNPPSEPGPVLSTALPVSDELLKATGFQDKPEDGRQKWVAHEIVNGETVVVGEVPAPAVHRLERAQALTELAKGTGMTGTLVADGIQSFKDTDGRTMNVMVSGGALYKQEV